MTRIRLTVATSVALALAGVSAATAAPAALAHGAGDPMITAGAIPALGLGAGTDAGVSALSVRQRRAKAKALKSCRRARKAKRRQACAKRVRKKYRALARRTVKPAGPTLPQRVHDVMVVDEPQGFGSFVPGTLELESGEAIRFIWPDSNKDGHNITLISGPAGVRPGEFEFGSAPSRDVTWQRTFKVTGQYVLGCSLHFTQKMTVNVTRAAASAGSSAVQNDSNPERKAGNGI